jgi:lipopolysaccharide heptosyltransferase II
MNLQQDSPVVSVHPGSTWETKRWGPLYVAKLCDNLQKQYNCQILLLGGTEEQDYLSFIRNAMRGEAVNLSGKTTLKELACILYQSNLMITMDSGPMHIACAVNTPVVALFGPTAPWRTGPFGENKNVIRKDLPCSPCFKRKCPEGHHRCMQEISIEDVLRACDEYLTQILQ